MTNLQRKQLRISRANYTTAVLQSEDYENRLHSKQARRIQMMINYREEFGVEEIQRKSLANSSNRHSESHQPTIQGK